MCPLHILLGAVRELIERAVKPGTRSSNLAALSVWKDFRSKCGGTSDLFLLDAPSPRDSALLVIEFIMWMRDTGKYSPNSIKTTCGKLRWNFICNVADDSVFDSPSVRTALKGLSANDGSGPANLRKSPNNSLLWILELNDLARDNMWVNRGQDDRMTYIAISLAFHFSLRIGEIASVGPYYKAPKFTPDHRFYWCDIVLEDRDGETEYSFVQFRTMLPKPDIELVLFLKNSSKTSGRERADGNPTT